MTNYKEILRLHSLGINNTRIAESCGCAHSTVIAALQRAAEQDLSWNKIKNCSTEEVARKLYPSTPLGRQYKMPDYERVHREMQKSGVTLSLLWVEYCEQCRQNGELPYKSTQFNKYYADYVHKTKATMHLEHKPGETLQVDWAGQTAALVDTDTGERLAAYLFVAVLPYSGYAYTEAFLDMQQEAWITGHVGAYRYFGGVTRILTPDNLKTGVLKNSRTETVLNKSYQEMAEHYGTAILPARPRSPKDKAFVEGSVGVVSTWILAALRNCQFLCLMELNQAIGEKLELFNHKPFQKREGSRASSSNSQHGGPVHHACGRHAPFLRNGCTVSAETMHHYSRSSCTFWAAYAKINHFLESGTNPITCKTICEKGFNCPKFAAGECPVKSPAAWCYQPLSADDLLDILHGIPVTGEAIKDLQAAKQFVSDYLYNQDVVTAGVIINSEIRDHFKLKASFLKSLNMVFKDASKAYQASKNAKRAKAGTAIPDWYEPTDKGLRFLPGVLAKDMSDGQQVFYAAEQHFSYRGGVYVEMSEMEAQRSERAMTFYKKVVARSTCTSPSR